MVGTRKRSRLLRHRDALVVDQVAVLEAAGARAQSLFASFRGAGMDRQRQA
jgi:hypothetical protein